jgi:WhiB family redox-sensing transcriptional regulator
MTNAIEFALRTHGNPSPPPPSRASAGPGSLTWMDQAGCRDADRDLFFPRRHDVNRRAQRALVLCAACPVRSRCLDHALSAPERYGIWGGTTARERGWDATGKRTAASPRPTPGDVTAQRPGPQQHDEAAPRTADRRGASGWPTAA